MVEWSGERLEDTGKERKIWRTRRVQKIMQKTSRGDQSSPRAVELKKKKKCEI